MKSTINLGYLVFLSVVAALGGFLFGYDTAVISGTIALMNFIIDILNCWLKVGLIINITKYFTGKNCIVWGKTLLLAN